MNGSFRILDFHCHVYPDAIAQRAVAGTSGFYGEPSHCVGTVGDLLLRQTEAGIDLSVIESAATTAHQVHSINTFIAQTAKRFPDRLIGFGTLYPFSESLGEDVRELCALGLRGIKLHPDIQGFALDDERCERMYTLCEEAGLILLLHTGDKRFDRSNPNRLLPVLRAHPGLTVVGAHFGGWSIWTQAYKSLAGQENLLVDCSSSLEYLTDEEALGVISAYGEDRVLFGTDYPMWTPLKTVERFLGLPLPERTKEKILFENAARLLTIEMNH